MADQPDNLDYEGGFLSETQREYLAENNEKSLEGYSNPSVWWDRVRQRYEGALMDLALLGSYTGRDEERVKELQESARQQLNGMGWQYKEGAPLAGIHAAHAIASTYDDGELMQLINPMQEVAKEVRQEREFTQKFIVKAVLSVLQSGNPGEEEILTYLNSYWPDRERVIEIAEQELSTD